MTDTNQSGKFSSTHRRLKVLSRAMDSSIRLPGGYRIGWDGIIGLVPGVGDLVGMGVSLYIVFGAARLGASKATLVRMLTNVGVEAVVGAVPLAGDLFDLVFKANSRNMRLLNAQLEQPAVTKQDSRRWVLVWGLGVILIFSLITWLVISLILAFFSWLF